MQPARNPSPRSELARQCVKCGLCLPHCPTYGLARVEAESPRGRIALMADMADNPGHYGATAPPSLDSCLGCRRCESACPAGVSYESLLVQSRAAVPPHLGWRERAALHLLASKPVLNGLLRLYRLAFPLLPAVWRPLPKPGKGQSRTAKTGIAIFTGCIADNYEAGARAALIRLLAAAGIAATVPERQSCCGQAALHAGQSGQAARLQARNQRALAGHERLLVMASGCISALHGRIGIPVEDAGLFLARHAEAIPLKSAAGLRVALHTACSASFNGGHQAIRQLLDRIPDLEVIMLPDSGCCGAAGLHQLARPERAAALRTPVLDAVNGLRVDALLSANIGCRLHLANAAGLPVLHPLEFMAQFLDEP